MPSWSGLSTRPEHVMWPGWNWRRENGAAEDASIAKASSLLLAASPSPPGWKRCNRAATEMVAIMSRLWRAGPKAGEQEGSVMFVIQVRLAEAQFQFALFVNPHQDQPRR